MALATRCPHCGTTFRVANDQLKLRAGLVRCGACKEIFNGIEHLLPPIDVPAAPVKPVVAPPVQPPPATIAPEFPLPGQPAATDEHEPIAEPASEPVPEPAEPAPPTSEPSRFSVDFHVDEASLPPAEVPAPSPAPPPDDPLQRMTLMDIDYMRQFAAQSENPQPAGDTATDSVPLNTNTQFVAADDDVVDPLDQAMADLDNKPWRNKARKSLWRRDEPPTETPDEIDALDAEEEPGFMARERRQQQLRPAQRNALRAAIVLLTIALLGQGLYLLRNQLAGWLPQTKPLLVASCEVLGCRIDLPAQIDAVSIESSELQTLATSTDTFVLTVLLRNSSNRVQAWPYIELTLNDANEKPLVRKVFSATDYLPSASEVQQGFARTSEKPVKLSFQLTQAKASGYRVYLFYP